MDDLTLMLGTRVNNYEVSGTSQVKDTGKVVPYVGAVYDLNDYLSAYASYTEIYLPQDDYRDRTNKPIEPDEGKNYEVGLKGEFFNGRLNASLAYFQVHEENRAVDDDDYIGGSYPGLDYASKGIKAKTKGWEAEVSGELSPGWQLQAGYTHKIMRDQAGKRFLPGSRKTRSISTPAISSRAHWTSSPWAAAYAGKVLAGRCSVTTAKAPPRSSPRNRSGWWT